jgi:hypothetical protein
MACEGQGVSIGRVKLALEELMKQGRLPQNVNLLESLGLAGQAGQKEMDVRHQRLFAYNAVWRSDCKRSCTEHWVFAQKFGFVYRFDAQYTELMDFEEFSQRFGAKGDLKLVVGEYDAQSMGEYALCRWCSHFLENGTLGVRCRCGERYCSKRCQCCDWESHVSTCAQICGNIGIQTRMPVGYSGKFRGSVRPDKLKYEDYAAVREKVERDKEIVKKDNELNSRRLRAREEKREKILELRARIRRLIAHGSLKIEHHMKREEFIQLARRFGCALEDSVSLDHSISLPFMEHMKKSRFTLLRGEYHAQSMAKFALCCSCKKFLEEFLTGDSCQCGERYCSSHCRKVDWLEHKHKCRKVCSRIGRRAVPPHGWKKKNFPDTRKFSGLFTLSGENEHLVEEFGSASSHWERLKELFNPDDENFGMAGCRDFVDVSILKSSSASDQFFVVDVKKYYPEGVKCSEQLRIKKGTPAWKVMCMFSHDPQAHGCQKFFLVRGKRWDKNFVIDEDISVLYQAKRISK